jgi:hypothetical protein
MITPKLGYSQGRLGGPHDRSAVAATAPLPHCHGEQEEEAKGR